MSQDQPSFGLNHLSRIDARDVWKHEAAEFTPWLLEHIDELNEAAGLEIELSGREERVGHFAVDLFGRDVQTGHPAIIENQLDITDHQHLGQLLTYAAGLKAGTIIWIAPKFREEHREALAWLNEISPPDVSFFGVELEVLEIGGQSRISIMSRPKKSPSNQESSPGLDRLAWCPISSTYAWAAFLHPAQTSNG